MAYQFKISTNSLELLDAKLNSIDKQIGTTRNKIAWRITAMLSGRIRSMLMDRLKSKFTLGTGNRAQTKPLADMVREYEIYYSDGYIRLKLADRSQGFSDNDYAKAGALQFGAIRGSRMNARKKAKAKAAALYSGSSHAAGGRVVKPHDFFGLDQGQLSQLQALFDAYLRAEISKAIARAA